MDEKDYVILSLQSNLKSQKDLIRALEAQLWSSEELRYKNKNEYDLLLKEYKEFKILKEKSHYFIIPKSNQIPNDFLYYYSYDTRIGGFYGAYCLER